MRVQIENYTELSNVPPVSITSTENENLVEIAVEGHEVTVSISELRAAALAFDTLRADV